MYQTTKLHLSNNLLVLFTIVQIILGNNFGFVKIVTKRTQKLLKVLCVFGSILVLTLILLVPTYKYPDHAFHFVTYAAEYVSYSLALWIAKYSFYDFLLDYSEIDDHLMLDSKSLDGTIIIALVYPAFSCAFKTTVFIVYCDFNVTSSYCKHFKFEYATNCITMIAVDSLILVQFAIMHMCYKRINILSLKLINNKLNATDVARLYKKIFDGLDKIKPVINKMVRNK
jgi:hypothetical protein